MSSCSSLSNLKQTVQAKALQIKAKPKRSLPAVSVVSEPADETIEFLDNISVK